jgi:hypothetical protein
MRPESREGAEKGTAAVQVLMKKIPYIAHGAVAIADMTSLRPCDYTFCRAGVAADDQVVIMEVEKLDCQWKQSRINRMMSQNTRTSLQKTDMNGSRTQRW